VLTRFGRRTLYTGGMASMSVVLFIIGGLGFIGSQKSDYAIGSLLIFLNFAYNATLGPICYTIIGEVSSTRLRAKSIVLARISYQLMNIVCGIIVPRMLSPTAWNWGPRYAGAPVLCSTSQLAGLTYVQACSGARPRGSRPYTACSGCPRPAGARTASSTSSSSTRSPRGASRGPRPIVRALAGVRDVHA
jgi:hypothetical protein